MLDHSGVIRARNGIEVTLQWDLLPTQVTTLLLDLFSYTATGS